MTFQKLISERHGFEFESSSEKTLQFKLFVRDFSSAFKNELKGSGLSIVSKNVGHFMISFFIRNDETKRTAYISMGDLRNGFDRSTDKILARTAKNEKDYVGGSNNYTNLNKLIGFLQSLTTSVFYE